MLWKYTINIMGTLYYSLPGMKKDKYSFLILADIWHSLSWPVHTLSYIHSFPVFFLVMAWILENWDVSVARALSAADIVGVAGATGEAGTLEEGRKNLLFCTIPCVLCCRQYTSELTIQIQITLPLKRQYRNIKISEIFIDIHCC